MAMVICPHCGKDIPVTISSENILQIKKRQHRQDIITGSVLMIVAMIILPFCLEHMAIPAILMFLGFLCFFYGSFK